MKAWLGENLGLKLFAALLAYVVWVWVAQHSDLVKVLKVPVLIDPPSGGLVLDYNPKELRVRIDGDSNDVRRVREEELQIRLDLGAEEIRGRRTLSLTARNVRGLPGNVSSEFVDNKQVEVTVDRSATRTLKVVVRTTGKPTPGWVVKQIVVEPDQLTVTGPVATLANLNGLHTEPLPLDGRDKNFDLMVDLDIDDPALRLDQNQVHVAVELAASSSQ